MIENHVALVLGLLVGLYGAFAVVDVIEYRRFSRLDATSQRQRVLRKWLVQSLVLHGLLSVACLALLGKLSALVTLPEPLLGLSLEVRSLGEGDEPWKRLLWGACRAFVPALLVGSVVSPLLRAKSDHQTQVRGGSPGPDPRNLGPLLPRNRRERIWTALLSLNAGVSEELAFRLLLPVLFWMVFADPVVAVVAPTLLFGVLHLYQGWTGVVTTALVGGLLLVVVLVTGSIWPAVAVHAAIDLGSLVVGPWYASRLDRRDAQRTNPLIPKSRTEAP